MSKNINLHKTGSFISVSKLFSLFSLLICFLIIVPQISYAQEEITVDDLYKKGTFRSNGVYGLMSMKDGVHYTNLNMSRNAIIKYSYETGEKVETIFKAADFENELFNWILDYQFSADESKILISVQYEPIYRHSFKAEYFIYDIEANTLTQLSENGKQQLASFSPDGSKIAFVRENNIYVKDITVDEAEEVQLTTDGEWNKIINGAPDWVYEEEFSYSQAYDWSADGKKIAFLKTDESNVKMFSMPLYGDLYPENYEYKYPKAGEENSKVSLHIVDIASKNIIEADMGDLNDKYIPRIKFTNDENILSAVKMNRLQNKYELFLINAEDGNSEVVLTLTDEKYIEINDDLTFLDDKEHFVLSHEGSGFRHLYLYDMNGEQVNQITTGDWEVTSFYGIDEVNGIAYFQAAKTSPLNREVYSIKLDGSEIKLLTERTGTNDANFSNGFKYFINDFSDANTPPYVTLHDNTGKQIRELETNKSLVKKVTEDYKFSKKEFFTFTTSEGIELNGWMIKPAKFKKGKKHPVFMYVYGGPGSQTVTNSWDRDMGWWQLLAQQGYIIVSVDNRGTGARGKDFRQVTYEQLGKYEVIDQIEAAKYLGTQKYVDPDRIGIFGWSYGGYMSSLCLTIGAKYFKLGIAVAPVTNWRYYDSIYTERYNGLPQDNASGYDDNSPINHAREMSGKFLMIHGTADDNVHFQNSVDFITKLIDADVDFETMYYPNKDHGIYGGNTRNHLYRKMTNYILENL
ncbi:MAG: S9 family peptidase [Marinilabiliales bacterium]|nr:MAG: S9 family peptidase [Marinilabiliales bacterium]